MDITPCSLVKANRLFGAAYRLHLQGRRVSLLTAGFLLGLLFNPEDGSDVFRRNVG
jgi:hypothetical protein